MAKSEYWTHPYTRLAHEKAVAAVAPILALNRSCRVVTSAWRGSRPWNKSGGVPRLGVLQEGRL